MFQDRFVCIKRTSLVPFLSVPYVESHVPYDLQMNKWDTQMNIQLYILSVSLDSETLYPTCVGRKLVKRNEIILLNTDIICCRVNMDVAEGCND